MAKQSKSIDQQLAALQLKMNALKTKKSKEDRAADTREKIIVGGMILHRATKDPQSALRLRKMLADDVTRDADKEAIAPLLARLDKIIADATAKAAPNSEGKLEPAPAPQLVKNDPPSPQPAPAPVAAAPQPHPAPVPARSHSTPVAPPQSGQPQPQKA